MSVNHIISETARGDYRQKSMNFDALMAQAKQARSGLAIFGRALANEIGGTFNLAANKDYKRARQKADNKYGGDVSRLTDLVRGRVIVDDVGGIIAAREILNPIKGSRSFLADWATICANGDGYRVQDFDDKHLEPTMYGWRDISIRVRVPLTRGQTHTGEIQVLHRHMEEADRISHPIYERQRRMLEAFQNSAREMTDREATKFAWMSAERLEVHNEAAERAGLHVLERPKLTAYQRLDAALQKFDKVA